MRIEDFINPKDFSVYYDTTMANNLTPYLGEQLFVPKKISGLEFHKIGGYAGAPIQLIASAFDVPTTFRDFSNLQETSKRLPLFKEGMKIDEVTRQKIIMASNSDVLKNFVSEVYDPFTGLINGARATREYMAMQLISTGKIKLVGHGVNLEYDFGLNKKKQMVSPKVDWDDSENATPLQDIDDWKDYFKTTYGVDLGFIVLTTFTFNKLKACKTVHEAIYPQNQNAGNVPVSKEQVKAIVEQYTGIKFLFEDNQSSIKVGLPPIKMYPDGVITLLPSNGILGSMVFGTTPAEADLQGKLRTNVEIREMGVAVYSDYDPDPVSLKTFVAQVCLPSFDIDVQGGSGTILIANVFKTK